MPERDPWLDNAKMGLVLLVVVGHLLAYLPADGPGGRLYDFIYLWHMPAFVFVTGYLSRSFTYTPRRLWQLVTTLLVPYLFFEGALAWFRLSVGDEDLRDLWLDPHFPLWFLLALVGWRLVTPLLAPLPAAVAVGVAVAVALGGGFLTGEWMRWLDLPRMLGFLPFFVLGLHATPRRLERLRGSRAVALALLVVAGLAWLARDLDSWASRAYLYQRPFELTDDSAVTAVLTRLAVLAVGIAGTAAWLALVPRIHGWFTRMGAATMVVYLVHGFFVKGLDYAGFGEWVAERQWTGTLVAVVLGSAIALALASAPMRRLLAPVVDPFSSAHGRVREAVDIAVVVSEVEAEVVPPVLPAEALEGDATPTPVGAAEERPADAGR